MDNKKIRSSSNVCVRKKVLHEKKKKERNACFLVTKKKVKTKNIALITLL